MPGLSEAEGGGRRRRSATRSPGGAVQRAVARDFDMLIEVGYRPG